MLTSNKVRCIVLLLCSFLSLQTIEAQEVPEGFVLEEIATELNPTKMRIAPDGRLFIAEKHGVIRVVEDDVMQEEVFLSLDVESFGERGLEGLAFHPDFEFNHYFYVYYTVPQQDRNRISRFTANGPSAIVTSEEVLMELDQLSGTVHNGGSMLFGPDGKLYVSTGDGTHSLNGQDLNTVLGKVLRLNDDGSIPEDNPFYNSTEGNNRAIYAYGFRNPFSMAREQSTGRIFVNDVGEGTYEEVNELEAGKNYGWNLIEGYIGGEEPPLNYQDPFMAYTHADGCAIVGGSFYDPALLAFPEEYHGTYFYTDYCDGYTNYLDPVTGAVLGQFSSDIFRPLGMLFDDAGAMYFLERAGEGNGSTSDNTASADGKLWKVTYTGNGDPNIGQQPQSQLAVIGDQVEFSLNATGAGELVYTWFEDGIALSGPNAATLLVDVVTLDQDATTYYCEVSNSSASEVSETVTLTVVDNSRPLPVILSPEEGGLYSAGEFVYFTGTASDPEDGPLGENQLSWWIDFHHNIHTHPGMPVLEGTETGAFEIPRIGETSTDVWYRIYLKAVDSEGLEQIVFRDVHPRLVEVTLESVPAGFDCIVDGQTVSTPYTYPSVEGVRRTVVLPQTRLTADRMYIFSEWADGNESPFLTFDTPQNDTSFQFTYGSVELGQGIGLTAEYFSEFEGDFESVEPDLTRIDTIIDFDWGFGSPDESISTDFFGARWTGYIRTFYEGEYTFYLLAETAGSLTVNGVELLDGEGTPHGEETTATMYLEADTEYPIRIQLTVIEWDAAVRFSWSHENVPYHKVLKQQLNPSRYLPDDPRISENGILVYPNPGTDYVQINSLINMEDVQLTDLSGKVLFDLRAVRQSSVRVPVRDLANGVYLIKVQADGFTATERLLIQH